METRKIEGWRSRQEREVNALRSAWYSSGTTVEILEDGDMVSSDQYLSHYVGRKTKRIINRGREWQEFDAYRRKLRLHYITEWQRLFKQKFPDRWKLQRSEIEARYRAKNREKRVQYLRDRRASLEASQKEEVLMHHRIYAQLVQLAGLRKT